MMRTGMQTLAAVLVECADVQATVGDAVITVGDWQCYSEGFLVKVNGEEPEGIRNMYDFIDELERDLARVVPGYEIGAPVWQEVEDDDFVG
jgi:hypothetical protein